MREVLLLLRGVNSLLQDSFSLSWDSFSYLERHSQWICDLSNSDRVSFSFSDKCWFSRRRAYTALQCLKVSQRDFSSLSLRSALNRSISHWQATSRLQIRATPSLSLHCTGCLSSESFACKSLISWFFLQISYQQVSLI
ncbi:hypothetical protein FGO68_gene12450 [Halteria grandinella]|uniref:Uncharacterized protein n=1 Tax=Halteria grandinella TaxID=5974 RepID=A0A8J8NY12_HALGN|nr:hypothetical protein FGO68_gene12450 [Halteria grandinella]